ncbi:GILT-like protein 1 [Paramyrothecium foliicola]|nr:GILT-like protein 1 [Paramyrothecium foliicola]
MDEKSSQQPNMVFRRNSRPAFIVLLLFAVVFSLWQCIRSGGLTFTPSSHGGMTSSQRRLVPLEAHIISKCPDTRDALRELILPVMQKVHDKVDFKLSYIGKLTADDGVECKHGTPECLGNIVELCARELYPDPKTNLGFIMCLTKDYSHIPERTLVEDCALEHAIDFQALNECATRDDGAHGMDLLRKSVKRSADVSILNLEPLFSHQIYTLLHQNIPDTLLGRCYN